MTSSPDASHIAGGAGQAVIDAAYASLVTSGVRQAGLNVGAILARSGIDPAALGSPNARLTQQQFARLISTLTRMTGDELWLLCSRKIRPGAFKTMCRLLVRCSDLGEALALGCRFYRLLADDFVVRVHAEPHDARVWITDRIADQDRRRMVNGAILLFVYGLMCWLVGRKLPLLSVHYVFSERAHSLELGPVYEAPILFDQTRTELRFDASLLGEPIIPDEARLNRFLASVPSVLLVRYRDTVGVSERVRTILRRNMARSLSLDDVAQRLHMTPQTLRRRIQEDSNCSFQELKDRVRHDFALRMLLKSGLSLDEIAAALGFSELSTFHRAFRRWTGYSPGEYRQLKKS